MRESGTFLVEITDLNHSGEGVGRPGGRVVFVPYACPGDVVEVRLTEERRNFARAELVSIPRASKDRVPAPCPVYLQCGGCQLQHVSYDAQLAYKARRVRQAFARIGRLEGVEVRDCVPAPQRFHYRNKARFSYTPVGGRPDPGRPPTERGFVSGFYGRRTHDVVDLNECIIQNPINNRVFQTLNAIAAERGVRVGDGDGAISHLLVRCAGRGEHALAVLETRAGRISGGAHIAAELSARVPELAGVLERVERVERAERIERTKGVEGDELREPRVLAGEGLLHENVCGVRLVVSADSFLQVNPAAMEVLYGEVLKQAGLVGDEVVVDAYCGIGAISLLLAKNCRRVYGIEAVPAAVKDARGNAALNHLENCTFVAARVEDALADRRKAASGLGMGLSRVDLVVLDPPRAGCAKGVVQAVAALRPSRIVYVSCDPETLARDLALLDASGYTASSAQPVDMFPQTAHVECVVTAVPKSA